MKVTLVYRKGAWLSENMASQAIKTPNNTLPYFACGVAAGFPSPADDYIEADIDLNQHLIKHPQASFLARANGDSMLELGIKDKDLLIVDRAIKPRQGDVVIAALNGEMTCKILDLQGRRLLPANQRCQPIALSEPMDLVVEGVVTHSVRYHCVRSG